MTASPHTNANDGDLLRRFVDARDDGAFTALLRRHGPTVLGVCRRVLRDPNDADDAFQATFLVLVRKAASIGRPELLANWLYGVAYRTALEAKTQAAKRTVKERQVPPPRPTEPAAEVVWDDVRPVLDEEVSRLPEKYRAAFVLCHLQGRTNDEAARLLGCPKGTILSRLAWARERLRSRLSRRGLALSAGLFAGLLSLTEASAAVPPALTVRTASAALAPAGAVSARVVSLTEGVLKAMWMTKVKTFVAVSIAAAVLVTAGLGAYSAAGADGKAAKGKTDRDRLQGKWTLVSVDHGGKKVEGNVLKGSSLTFKGDKVALVIHGASQEGGVRLKSDATPRQIDLIVSEDGKKAGYRGIYELDGYTLRICITQPPAARPTEFATAEGQQFPAIVDFRRAKK